MKLPTTLSNQQARLQADFLLLLVSVIWGSAFAAQRVAALHLNAFLFNGLRFLIGAAVLLPLARRTWQIFDRRALAGSALAGLMLFGGTAFQQLGLKYTTAGNAGFITGLYVVLIPLFLAIGWRQKPRTSALFGSLLAALGLFLLSTGGRLAPPGSLPIAAGDRLELVGAALFALHVIWIGQLVRQVPVLPLAIVQYLVCGMLSLAAAGVSPGGIDGTGLDIAWWTVVYTGIFSIGVGYTLQAVGQRVAPPADAAILLSAEAVFAAFFGWLFLSERLAALQLLGCALILASMLVSQFSQLGNIDG